MHKFSCNSTRDGQFLSASIDGVTKTFLHPSKDTVELGTRDLGYRSSYANPARLLDDDFNKVGILSSKFEM